MNDIQAKENIYNVATAAVAKQEKNVSNANNQLVQVENAYLQNVVYTAMIGEKIRRKKDFFTNLIIWETAVVVCLILFLIILINPIAGGVAVVAIGLTALIVKNKSSGEREYMYNARRSFFAKYAHAVPAGQQLKWKKNSFTHALGNEQATSTGWICSNCSTHNSDTANFCMSCGEYKPH